MQRVISAVVPAFSHWARRILENTVPEKIRNKKNGPILFHRLD